MLPQWELWISTRNTARITLRRHLSESRHWHSSLARHIRTLRSALQPSVTGAESPTSTAPFTFHRYQHTSSPSSNCSLSCLAHHQGFYIRKVLGSNPHVHYRHMFMVLLGLSTQTTGNDLKLRHSRLMPRSAQLIMHSSS
jgi:hypothetical protein